MEVSVSHTPSGRSCVVPVADTDTVRDLKAHALQELFAGSSTDRQASMLAAHLRGGDGRGPELGDTQRIADTGLESGGGVQLVPCWPAVKAPAEYTTGRDCINAAALSPCGSLYCAATDARLLFVFDTTTAETVTEKPLGQGWVMCVAFSQCSTRLAICYDNHKILIYHTGTWECSQTLEGHTTESTCLQWTHCGRAVSGSSDTTVRVWDVEGGACTAVLEGHTAVVNAVAVSRTHIFSGSDDGTIRMWDLATLTHTTTLTEPVGFINSLALTTDGERLVSCSSEGAIKVWGTKDLTEVLDPIDDTRGSIYCLGVSQEGDAIAAIGEYDMFLWRLSTGKRLRSVGNMYMRSLVHFSPCGKWIFSSVDNLVRTAVLSDML